MPVLRLYPNGLTGGVAPMSVNPAPVPRGDCAGWSLKSSRSNTRFLYSVRSFDLPESADGSALLGLALSFTIRDCPPAHDDWQSLRRSFVKRLERRGLYRLHWLTEWQRRGVPHLHAALWFDLAEVERWMAKNYDPFPVAAFPVILMADWLDLSRAYRSSIPGQDIKPITNDLGWLQYLSKHAARGAAHYQRSIGSHPSGWVKTGRMWGHLGDWPVSEPFGINLDNPGWYAFRRIVRRWRIANARCSKNPARRIRAARRMLKCSQVNLSRVRGVSEWINADLGMTILQFLSQSGYCLESV